MTEIDRCLRTLDRYWAIYERDEGEVVAAVAACFAPEARFESPALSSVLVGHDAIAERVTAIHAIVRAATVERDDVVQWSHRTARWSWRWSDRSGVVAGTDVAHFADDGRIDLLAVFPD